MIITTIPQNFLIIVLGFWTVIMPECSYLKNHVDIQADKESHKVANTNYIGVSKETHKEQSQVCAQEYTVAFQLWNFERFRGHDQPSDNFWKPDTIELGSFTTADFRFSISCSVRSLNWDERKLT